MSPKEKRYWLMAIVVTLAIFSTLFLGRPLQRQLSSQNVQAAIFLVGMALTGGAIASHGFRTKVTKGELATWLGLSAILIMFMLRLGLAERTHLIEYGVLTVIIHKAMVERFGNRSQTKSVISAFIVGSLIGLLDESIQHFLPTRVFDPQDILFNCLACLMAIGGTVVVRWASNKFQG